MNDEKTVVKIYAKESNLDQFEKWFLAPRAWLHKHFLGAITIDGAIEEAYTQEEIKKIEKVYHDCFLVY